MYPIRRNDLRGCAMASIRITGYRRDANALWEILKNSGYCVVSDPKTYPRVATNDQTKFIFKVEIDHEKLDHDTEQNDNG